jgi:hypothetical protein
MPLSSSDEVGLWIHFEERAAEIRGQMLTTLTSLQALGAPVLGAVITGFLLRDSQPLPVPLALVASIAGLIISTLSILLLADFRDHIRRSYDMSKEIRATSTDLKSELDQWRASSLHIPVETLHAKRARGARWTSFVELFFLLGAIVGVFASLAGIVLVASGP